MSGFSPSKEIILSLVNAMLGCCPSEFFGSEAVSNLLDGAVVWMGSCGEYRENRVEAQKRRCHRNEKSYLLK
jgi:hypothetical protein